MKKFLYLFLLVCSYGNIYTMYLVDPEVYNKKNNDRKITYHFDRYAEEDDPKDPMFQEIDLEIGKKDYYKTLCRNGTRDKARYTCCSYFLVKIYYWATDPHYKV